MTIKLAVFIVISSLSTAPSHAHSQSLAEVLGGCKWLYNHEEFESKNVSLKALDSDWMMVDRKALEQVLPNGRRRTENYSGVPLQGKSTEYMVSCGPISVSMAQWLVAARSGVKIPADKSRWRQFVLGFPYFLAGVMPHQLVSHTKF